MGKILAVCLLILVVAARSDSQTPVGRLPGLQAPAKIIRDSNHVPHIIADSDRDAFYLNGYVHAQDRFFQMDYQRRLFSGTLAEVLGQGALSEDILFRTLGLRRAAEASAAAYSAEARSLLEAYAAGVNAWLREESTRLPPEYQALELSKSSVPEWTIVDSVTVAKGLAFSLSVSSVDIELTEHLAAYQEAGRRGGFDGNVLFFEDAFGSAPFEPAISIPGFLPEGTAVGARAARREAEPGRPDGPEIAPETARLAAIFRERLRRAPVLEQLLRPRTGEAGSNWFLVSGRLTQSGAAMIANDPHLSLGLPSVFCELHLMVDNDPERGPLNVVGVSFPGVPGVVQGCNERICWGSTVNPMDTTDFYQERLVINLLTLRPVATVFEGRQEPLVLIEQSFRVNRPRNGAFDDLERAAVGALEGGLTALVPRRNNGPIVAVDAGNLLNITGLSMQYTGWSGTRELETFLGFARARNADEFQQALRKFTSGNQNWAYADRDGNIAYFTGSDLPLREDLQTLGRVEGAPPYLVRDGTHARANEWLRRTDPPPAESPYELLPFEEMPQSVNPPSGYIANCNNDPVGTTLDNNPLNQRRRGGGIYYLSPGYDGGFRQGRAVGLIEDVLRAGRKVTMDDLVGMQANTQMLDAQRLLPHLLAAYRNAAVPGAPPELAALANDAGIAEAIARLERWDYSAPTGIREGYDAYDNPDGLAEPSPEEVGSSVAATLYSVWRGQVLRATVDATLTRLGLADNLPGDDQSLRLLRLLLDNFEQSRGRGRSGVNFFRVDGVAAPEAARDVVLLRSLRSALDLLAGDSFAAAFGNSKLLDDYRWGRLHRIVFSHALGGTFSAPPAGGFVSVEPRLPGVAKQGGFGVLDASGHNPRADAANRFTFGSGPARRFVAEVGATGIRAFQVIPGGQSGDVTSAHYTSQLGRWLTNSYHPVLLTRDQVLDDQQSVVEMTPVP